MLNPIQIEEVFQEYSANLSTCVHDGVFSVNVQLLYELGLLEECQKEAQDMDDLAQYFHVMETAEKVTLFNEQFVIWIVPKMEEEKPITYVMIALNSDEKIHLEIVFTTTGVYNTPKYVLKVLQYYLIDMLDTEATLTAIEKNQS